MSDSPIQLFGCWLRSHEEPFRHPLDPPSYWVGGRCAGGCHSMGYVFYHERMGDSWYVDAVGRGIVARLALAHAGFGE